MCEFHNRSPRERRSCVSVALFALSMLFVAVANAAFVPATDEAATERADFAAIGNHAGRWLHRDQGAAEATSHWPPAIYTEQRDPRDSQENHWLRRERFCSAHDSRHGERVSQRECDEDYDVKSVPIPTSSIMLLIGMTLFAFAGARSRRVWRKGRGLR
jgi:hypothetical protein